MGNVYLEGTRAPVQEEVTATDLAVTGEIPEELEGRWPGVGIRRHPTPPATPAQGLMRETVSTQEMDINDTLKHP